MSLHCASQRPDNLRYSPWRAGLLTSLTVQTTAEADGLTLYEYTLTNDASSDEEVVGLSIYVNPASDLQEITAPNGWNSSYLPGDWFVGWDIDPLSTLLPGSSTTVSFKSLLSPISQTFDVTGFNDQTGDSTTNRGPILGPGVAVVPEPSSLTLLCIGSIAVAAARGCTPWQWMRIYCRSQGIPILAPEHSASRSLGLLALFWACLVREGRLHRSL